MPATVKTSTYNDSPVDLPKQHVAILFEGAWLFTPDPSDATRVLAICPYQGAPDHVCVYGVWPHPPCVEGTEEVNAPLTGLMPEGNQYRVDLEPSRTAATNCRDLFQATAAKYGNIYLRNTSSTHEMTVSAPPQTRSISVPLPDEIRGAGKLQDAKISLGAAAAGNYALGIDGEATQIFVTLIFIYEYDGDKPLFSMKRTAGPDEPAALATPPAGPTHLVIRVYAPIQLRPADTTVDQDHLIDTFEQLRDLVVIHPADSSGEAPMHPDASLLAPRGQVFERGDTCLTLAELGLPFPGDVHPTYGNLAACAGGTCLVDPIP